MEDVKNTSIEFYNSDGKELITSTTKVRIHHFIQYGDMGLDIDVDLKDVPENLRGFMVQILWTSRQNIIKTDNKYELPYTELGYLGKLFKWMGKIIRI